jgi:hypothetical protein
MKDTCETITYCLFSQKEGYLDHMVDQLTGQYQERLED